MLAKRVFKNHMTTQQKTAAPRFGIAEWYGQSFVHLSPQERSEFATYKPNKELRLSASENDRLVVLTHKSNLGALTPKEDERRQTLAEKQRLQFTTNKPCPFKSSAAATHLCTKEGGVC